MLPKRTGVLVGFSRSALTLNPVPGVKKTTPRGELALKKFGGRKLGSATASGTASQLISRRPVPNEPPTPLLFPKKVLNAFTSAKMSEGLAPDASKTVGSAANTSIGNHSITATKTNTMRFIGR